MISSALVEQERSGFGGIFVLPAVEQEHSVHDAAIGSSDNFDTVARQPAACDGRCGSAPANRPSDAFDLLCDFAPPRDILLQ